MSACSKCGGRSRSGCDVCGRWTRAKEKQATMAEDDILDAQENLAYWRRQAAIRMTEEGKAEARGRVQIWASTLAARVEKFNPRPIKP